MADVSLSFAGHRLVPMRCGALWWPAEAMLIVADLHFEKGSAFARRGWLLPPHDTRDTLDRLQRAIEETGARRVVALGDSFHDPAGPARLEARDRGRLQALVGSVEWQWIVGNHDGASAAMLGGMAFEAVEQAGIWFRHEAEASGAVPEISGHFHPKANLVLRTGRRVSRRCFALAADRLVCPAYGAYAGGLAVSDPAFLHALGMVPTAVIVTGRGLAYLHPDRREIAA